MSAAEPVSKPEIRWDLGPKESKGPSKAGEPSAAQKKVTHAGAVAFVPLKETPGTSRPILERKPTPARPLFRKTSSESDLFGESEEGAGKASGAVEARPSLILDDLSLVKSASKEKANTKTQKGLDG
jgi:hypothetical protein